MKAFLRFMAVGAVVCFLMLAQACDDGRGRGGGWGGGQGGNLGGGQGGNLGGGQGGASAGADLTFTAPVQVRSMVQGQPVRAGQPIVLWMAVSNQGQMPSGPWAVRLKVRDPFGTYPDRVYPQPRGLGPGEQQGPVTVGTVDPRTGAMHPPTFLINQPGNFQVTVVIETQGDVNPSNNLFNAAFVAY